jgi:hypothetical protein
MPAAQAKPQFRRVFPLVPTRRQIDFALKLVHLYGNPKRKRARK